jgi:hypothetical protein
MLGDGLHDVPDDRIAAVVTSLEMRTRPARRPEIAGPWTLERLAQPSAEAYRALYGKIGDEWLWFSRMLMADETLLPIIRHPNVEIYALKVGDDREGLLELDFQIEGEAELAFFGVGSSLIGGGAARWMMNRALELAWARPIQRFWVHTCTLDPLRLRAVQAADRNRTGPAAARRLHGVAETHTKAGALDMPALLGLETLFLPL